MQTGKDAWSEETVHTGHTWRGINVAQAEPVSAPTQTHTQLRQKTAKERAVDAAKNSHAKCHGTEYACQLVPRAVNAVSERTISGTGEGAEEMRRRTW